MRDFILSFNWIYFNDNYFFLKSIESFVFFIMHEN